MVKPIVLVHGAFTGSWEWDHVVPLLRERGISVTAVDLTTMSEGGSLAADEQLVRDAIAAAGDAVVLVGHSYSGAVITGTSAGNSAVAHLVYVAAAVPEDGESVVAARDAAPTGAPSGVLEPVDRAATASRLFNDATAEQREWAEPQLAPFVRAAMDQIPSGVGWKEHSASYVVCTQDLAFTVELQDRYAARLNERIVLDAGHSPMITQPAELSDILAEIAERA